MGHIVGKASEALRCRRQRERSAFRPQKRQCAERPLLVLRSQSGFAHTLTNRFLPGAARNRGPAREPGPVRERADYSAVSLSLERERFHLRALRQIHKLKLRFTLTGHLHPDAKRFVIGVLPLE